MCFSISSIGRTNVDSLLQVWSDHNQPDTARLEAMHSIILIEYLFSQPDSAFFYSQLQFNLAKKKGLRKYMANSLNIQGVALSIQGDYYKAIIYHNKSLKIREEIKDQQGIASSYNNIGSIYADQNDYSKAIEYYSNSLKIKKKINDKYGIANSYSNIGLIYDNLGNYTKAIKHYNTSLKIHKAINHKQGIAIALGNLGTTYLYQKNYNTAIDYFNRALAIQEEVEDKRGLANSMMNLGKIHSILGDSLSNTNATLSKSMYAKALDFSSRALIVAKQVGAVNEIRDASMNLYISYKHIGNYNQSLKMYELYTNTKDSIGNIETQRHVIRQEFKYQYEKQVALSKADFIKQQKLDRLSRQNERYVIIGTFSLILILFGVYLRIRFIRKQAEKEILLQEIKFLKTETVIKRVVNSNELMQLDKSKIDMNIEGSLNPSDWKILNVLYSNPVISNKEIAAQVSLSIDGVRSSLRKMYRLFDIQKSNENQRIALVIKATKISKTSL